jgi:alpha-1,2-rhamnosyltransferase
LVEQEHGVLFRNYFLRLLRVSSGIITISHVMTQEVRDYLVAHHPEAAKLPIVPFHLGQDIRGTAGNRAESVRPHIADLVAHHRFYLSVGTLEPRKGYAELLEAFARRWEQDTSLTLCIVGKIGWKCHDELRRIRRSAYLDSRLFFLSDVTDAELSLLYQHCQAVVLPSLAEGFGLPLAEAIGLGARVIANDIPIFHEVGGDYPLYYGRAPELLNSAIDEMETRIGAGWRPQPRAWLNWDEAAVQFASAVKSVLDQRR